VLLAFSVHGSIGDFLEQDVSFAVDHSIALPDDRVSDSLRQVALSRAGWTSAALV
jgi:hypothetical protein